MGLKSHFASVAGTVQTRNHVLSNLGNWGSTLGGRRYSMIFPTTQKKRPHTVQQFRYYVEQNSASVFRLNWNILSDIFSALVNVSDYVYKFYKNT